jgi:alkylhydroperoxidase/carboxymuconolactone decarboxylase family protein YurZ
MTTPFIRWIEDEEATGQAAEIYGAYKAANPHRPRMPDILKCFSLRPDFLQQVIDFSYGLHFSDGHLTRRVKEMIATYVSALNRCPY